MRPAPSRTAIILFSRTAAAEARSKPFMGQGRLRATTAITRELTAGTLQALRHTGLDLHWFQEQRQRGNTFGERLTNAFTDIFARGYTAAIAVGNDCPDLSSIDWEAVEELLAGGHCVLGPDFRGGAYLIGLQAQGFDPQGFASLPWQTSKLRAALEIHLSSGGPCTLLAQFQDLNSIHDLRYWAGTRYSTLARKLAAISRDIPTAPSPAQRTLQQYIPTQAPLRGPPALA